MDPAIIAGVFKGLGGLFGRKKTMSPAQSIMSTARGVTRAAAETGLNRLTLLGASNATAGAGMDMGTPPLASLSVLGDFIDDNFSDEAKQRSEHNQLQTDLLRLEVEKANAVRPVAPPSAVRNMGGAPAPLGVMTATRSISPDTDWESVQGPRDLVRVRNGLNGAWIMIDPGVADRLRIKEGDTMIGEDYEALLGDVTSEAVNVGSLATGVTTGVAPIHEPRLPPKRPVTPTPLKNHLVPEDWWKQQF